MDDIRRMFDKFTPDKTTYKKFNPNPIPQRNWWDIEQPPEPTKPFPEYEEWRTQTEAGTLPEEFRKEIPGRELLEEWGGLPEELEGAPTYTPTGIPTDISGEIPQYSPDQIMDLLLNKRISGPDIDLMVDLGWIKLPEEEEKPITFPEAKDEFVRWGIQQEMNPNEIEGLWDLLHPVAEEEITPEDTAKKMIEAVADVTKYTEEGGDIHDLPLDYLIDNNLLDGISAEELIDRGYFSSELLEDIGNELRGGTPDEELIEGMIEEWNVTRKLAELTILKAREYTTGE